MQSFSEIRSWATKLWDDRLKSTCMFICECVIRTCIILHSLAFVSRSLIMCILISGEMHASLTLCVQHLLLLLRDSSLIHCSLFQTRITPVMQFHEEIIYVITWIIYSGWKSYLFLLSQCQYFCWGKSKWTRRHVLNEHGGEVYIILQCFEQMLSLLTCFWVQH